MFRYIFFNFRFRPENISFDNLKISILNNIFNYFNAVIYYHIYSLIGTDLTVGVRVPESGIHGLPIGPKSSRFSFFGSGQVLDFSKIFDLGPRPTGFGQCIPRRL